MFKIIVAFVSLFIILFFGIDMFRKLTRKEKWNYTKLAAYSAGVSVLTFAILVGVVVLF
jgi:hypothetical protein